LAAYLRQFKQGGDVGYWPDPEVPVDGKRVRLLGWSGKLLLGLSFTESDPLRTIVHSAKHSCPKHSETQPCLAKGIYLEQELRNQA
jgi:hypothetical protein